MNANNTRSNQNRTQNRRANSQGQQGTAKKKRNRGRKRQDPRKFWGDPERLPEPPYNLTPTHATDAVVQSLGRPPIPGHESSALHYFRLVYDRSVSLAFALAAAGGLDQDAPPPRVLEDLRDDYVAEDDDESDDEGPDDVDDDDDDDDDDEDQDGDDG